MSCGLGQAGGDRLAKVISGDVSQLRRSRYQSYSGNLWAFSAEDLLSNICQSIAINVNGPLN